MTSLFIISKFEIPFWNIKLGWDQKTPSRLYGTRSSHAFRGLKKQAVQVNIAIMRAFVKLRGILSAHRELSEKLKQIEQRLGKHDKEIETIFHAIRQLMMQPVKLKTQIGFHLNQM